MLIKKKTILSVLILLILVLIISLIQGCCPFSKAIGGIIKDSSIESGAAGKNTDEYDELPIDHGVFSGIPNNYRVRSVKIPGQAIDVELIAVPDDVT